MKNNLACQHVKLHNFVDSARFKWAWWSEAHIVWGFSHSSEVKQMHKMSRAPDSWDSVGSGGGGVHVGGGNGSKYNTTFMGHISYIRIMYHNP